MIKLLFTWTHTINEHMINMIDNDANTWDLFSILAKIVVSGLSREHCKQRKSVSLLFFL